VSDTTRFIAASIAKMPGSIIEQLLAMRRAIAPFNAARALHTVLLYAGGWFVQWHEGPADAVDRTWRISLGHTTHHHPRIVHRSEGAATLVEPVQIAALVGPDKATDVARKLFEIDGEQKAAPLEPVDIWRRVAAPPSGRFAGLPAGAHRTLVVVSEYTESVELVKALAEHCRVPMNYQRFAGPDLHTGDAGAAYVDIGYWGQRTRVQALSRHVLGYGIVRLALSQVDAIVLLPNRRPHSAAALHEVVAPFTAALEREPAFHVVGTGRSHLEAVLDIAAHVHSRM
jgi:hypothetical protein